jgi:hypothetical protein
MTIAEREERNRKIIEYRKTHTDWETAIEFGLSLTQIFRIRKRFEQDAQKEQQNATN